jgi:hypothetical protein
VIVVVLIVAVLPVVTAESVVLVAIIVVVVVVIGAAKLVAVSASLACPHTVEIIGFCLNCSANSCCYCCCRFYCSLLLFVTIQVEQHINALRSGMAAQPSKIKQKCGQVLRKTMDHEFG